MYRVTYGDELLHDPRSEVVRLGELYLDQNVDECGFCDFTIYPNHPMYGKIVELDSVNPIRVYSNDEIIFQGFIHELGKDFQTCGLVKCKGDLAYLEDSIVRPYSTIPGIYEQEAPPEVSNFFTWLVKQHNDQCDATKRFEVGINEANLLDKNNYIFRESKKLPTTLDELREKLLDNDNLGGHIMVRYPNGVRTIDYLAEFYNVNTQVFDFGVNLMDYNETDDALDVYTAIIPTGKTRDAVEGEDPDRILPLDLSSLDDGIYAKDTGYYKLRDMVYNIKSVEKYGFKCTTYSNEDITTASELLDAGVLELKRFVSPIKTIEIKAVDLALISNDFKPLKLGEYVRVRSKPHNFDSYMLCASINPDLNNPKNSVYTLGITFDTLTGQQNKKINELNATVNANYETTKSISEEAKQQATVANAAAIVAKDTADAANITAGNASATATEAKSTATQTASDLSNYATNTNLMLEDMQGQIDGSITTWFFAVPPTSENAPANEWTTTDLKNSHLGDLYYDTDTGYSYRWQVLQSVYSWQRITDVDVTKALADAAQAQDTADAKRRVFYSQPVPPYDKGDLWSQGTDGDMLICSTPKTDGMSYLASDWDKATKYTDDAKAIEAADIATEAAKTATDFIDFGEDGLIVGDMTDGALSGNVRIASDGIELRDGTSVLARLKSTLIELGINAKSSIISLCGGVGTISAEVGGTRDYLIITGNPVLRGYEATISADHANLYGNIDLYLGAGRLSGYLSDWVVSSGVSGGWKWRKWASGKCECMGYHICSPTFNIVLGAGWYRSDIGYNHPFPFQIFDAVVQKTLVPNAANSGSVILMTETLPSEINSGDVYFILPQQESTSREQRVVIKVEGRWK